MMRVRLDELAKRLGADIAGDGTVEITGVGGIREAQPGQITFLANPKYEVYLSETRASAVILGGDHPEIGKPALLCANPYVAFLKVLKLFSADRAVVAPGVHATAIVGEGVALGQDVAVGPYAVIGDGARIGDAVVLMSGVHVGPRCRIGRGTFVYPNVVIREETEIGERVLIHAGAVIGDDGFGFAKDGKSYLKIPQVGNVVIEDDVEIGANTTVDRATTGTTRIGSGTRIDNLV
jgi:UDP-3-O-[3-hydroxymyristoyl] glucosamine N-acyltransferase